MAGTGMRMRLHRGILIYILSFALHATAGGAHSVTSSFSLLSPLPLSVQCCFRQTCQRGACLSEICRKAWDTLRRSQQHCKKGVRGCSNPSLGHTLKHCLPTTKPTTLIYVYTTYTYMYENLCLAIRLNSYENPRYLRKPTKTVRKPYENREGLIQGILLGSLLKPLDKPYENRNFFCDK